MATPYKPQLCPIKEVTETMADSLAAFLGPDDLLNALPSVDIGVIVPVLNSDEISCRSSKDKMLMFLNWLLNDGSAQVLFELNNFMRQLGEDPDPSTLISSERKAELSKVTSMARLFTELIDGKKFEMVTENTFLEVVNVLFENKMLKTTNFNFIGMKQVDAFMEVFKSVRRNKPHWPFIVWMTLEKRHPTLFKTTGDQLQEDNPSVYSGYGDERLQKQEDGALQEDNPSIYSSRGSSVTEGRQQRAGKVMELNIDEYVAHLKEKDDHDRTVTYSRKQQVDPEPYFSDDDLDEEELQGANNAAPSLKLRDYQKELAEEALYGRNVIICAPTGSGKTRVATHIIINHLEQSSEKNVKKVCFFAKTVPLTIQQHKNISKYLPSKYKTFLVTGESSNCLSLAAFLPETDVVVMTPMILQNHFNRGLLKDLSVFTLLVFDECHHTRKSEEYNTLMLSYLKMRRDSPSSPLPQVLGLTASLPTEKANSVEEATESILQLCANLAVENISTVNIHSEELKCTVPDPNEEILPLYEQEDKAFVMRVNAIMHELEKVAQRAGTEIASDDVQKLLAHFPSSRKSQEYNQWTVNLRQAAECVPLSEFETNMSVRTLMTIAQTLMVYNVALEAFDLIHVKDVIAYLETCFKPFLENEQHPDRESMLLKDFEDLKRSEESFQLEENSNLMLLLETIDQHIIRKDPESRGIVFVKTRFLAKALADWMNRCETEAVRNLKGTFFTGSNAPEVDGGMTQVQQEACLDGFRRGEIRLLLATNVLEEGTDVPECNLVIKYNYVGNEISTIQAKGRSRRKGGQSLLLAMPNLHSREIKNKFRAKIMYEAVREVQAMENAQRLNYFERFQKAALIAHENLKQEQAMNKSEKPFRMICKGCRQTLADSDHIRTIIGVHRIITDWNIWQRVRAYKADTQFLDDIEFIGSVVCDLPLPRNGTCRKVLGTAIVFRRTIFFAAGIKNVGFIEKGSDIPQFHNQWKKVKYAVPEISIADLKRYMEDRFESRANSQR